MDSARREIEVLNGRLEKELVVEEHEGKTKMRNTNLIKNEEEEEEEDKKEDESLKEGGNDDNEEENQVEDDDDDDDDSDEEENQVRDDEDEEEEEEQELVLDLKFVRDHFTPGGENEVPLASYVKAFIELNKFIKMLGNFYHFVAYDVKRKLATLRKKMAGENSQYYVDMKTMIEYEVKNNLIEHQKSMSGTEALLMLHRGLDFARHFMIELLKEEEEPSMGEAASNIYLATTGRFHPSLLRTPFSLVLKNLDSRATIRRRIAKQNEEAVETLKRLLPETISAITETYNVCEKMFEDNNLLSMK